MPIGCSYCYVIGLKVRRLPSYENKLKKYTSCYCRLLFFSRAEQELLLRRSSTYGDDKLKGRKSLFRRSKKGSSHHAINHSRESSDSKVDMEITSTVSSGTSLAFLTGNYWLSDKRKIHKAQNETFLLCT